MKTQTPSECHLWLTNHHFHFDEMLPVVGKEGFVYLPQNGINMTMKIPEDSWRRLLFSHQLTKWIGDGEILFWITSWPVYQEVEMNFFDAFRKAHGDTRRLIDAPAYLFDANYEQDVWAISEIVMLLITFNWEGFILRSDQDAVIRISDEIIETFTRNKQKNDNLQNIVDGLSIDYLKQ